MLNTNKKKLQLKKATKKLTLCPSHSWNPMGLFFLVLVCLFVCFCFLEIFATSAFCPKLPKTNGKNEQTMKVYEWLAHVYSVTSHAYHPRVHFLLIFSWCVLMFSWFGHPSRKLPETMGGNASQPRLENRIG
jgi:hypothetical protein